MIIEIKTWQGHISTGNWELLFEHEKGDKPTCRLQEKEGKLSGVIYVAA